MDEKQDITLHDVMAHLQQMSQTNDIRFTKIDERFDAIDKRFDGMDQRFDALEERLTQRSTHWRKTWLRPSGVSLTFVSTSASPSDRRIAVTD